MNDSTILVMTTTATPVNASGNTTNRDQEEDDYKNEKETSINTNEKDDVEATTTTNKEENTSKLALFQQKCIQFYWVNEFLILVVIVICLAKAYPPLGAEYLYPQITATWMAVIFIFFMAGLSLQTAELSKSFQRVYFNITVQVFNFCIVSGIVFGVATLLETSNILSKDLASGMIICSCLPITINMVMVLSIASGGDEAAAIFHAAVGNMLGVVVSPALILLYIGASANLNVGEVFLELLLRVIVPVIVGQVIQKLFQQVVAFVKTHKHLFKQTQQYTLVYIVYTVFCRTFAKQDENDGGTIGDIFLMSKYSDLIPMFECDRKNNKSNGMFAFFTNDNM